MFKFSCPGGDEIDSFPKGCRHQCEGLGTAHIARRVKFEHRVHSVL